jgi:hypothetical protein
MRNFIIKLISFIIIVIALDFSAGKVLDYIANNAKGGDVARINYINNKSKEDILIMGSSRAKHHYNPLILEDSLKMSVYNCGMDANGVLLAYTQLVNILDRYTPKVIIYDVNPSDDYYPSYDNRRYLEFSQRFYGKTAAIDSLFLDVDKWNKIKMYSNFYRHNPTVLLELHDYIRPVREYTKGYLPRYNVMPDRSMAKIDKNQSESDSIKMKYLRKFVEKCKSNNIKLAFAASPMYDFYKEDFAPIYELSRQYSIPVIMHYQDTNFSGHNIFFDDSYHMNNVGAEKYTKSIVPELRKALNI